MIVLYCFANCTAGGKVSSYEWLSTASIGPWNVREPCGLVNSNGLILRAGWLGITSQANVDERTNLFGVGHLKDSIRPKGVMILISIRIDRIAGESRLV